MTLIDEFIQGYNLPPTLGDGKTGGDALVGWSLGNIVTCAAISSAKWLSPDVNFRLATYSRALVLQGTWYQDGCSSSSILLSDSPTVALSLHMRPTWFPCAKRAPLFFWQTSGSHTSGNIQATLQKKFSMMQCRKYFDSFFRFYVFFFFALTSFDNTQQIQRQTSAGSLLAVTICYNPSLL